MPELEWIQMVSHEGSGLLSFRTLASPFLATGARQDVFHIIISTLSRLYDRLKMCCEASLEVFGTHALKRLRLTLEGPLALVQFPYPLISCYGLWIWELMARNGLRTGVQFPRTKKKKRSKGSNGKKKKRITNRQMWKTEKKEKKRKENTSCRHEDKRLKDYILCFRELKRWLIICHCRVYRADSRNQQEKSQAV